MYKIACCIASDNDSSVNINYWLIFSNDTIASNSAATLTALQEKHPSPSIASKLPDPPSSEIYLQATEESVAAAILSFPNGSASGLDGLSPQHINTFAT